MWYTEKPIFLFLASLFGILLYFLDSTEFLYQHNLFDSCFSTVLPGWWLLCFCWHYSNCILKGLLGWVFFFSFMYSFQVGSEYHSCFLWVWTLFEWSEMVLELWSACKCSSQVLIIYATLAKGYAWRKKKKNTICKGRYILKLWSAI